MKYFLSTNKLRNLLNNTASVSEYEIMENYQKTLKCDVDIIGISESDGSSIAYDIKKMLPYFENCDMIVGTRQNQILTEKGNQNKVMHVWGNFCLAKLIQIKYFSLLHAGVINLTDVGC